MIAGDAPVASVPIADALVVAVSAAATQPPAGYIVGGGYGVGGGTVGRIYGGANG